MEDLEKWQAVNACETLEDLAKVIESFSDENGDIQGRNKKFSANKMALCCKNYFDIPKNTLTREFGIRQQAIYILYYTRKL